MLDAEIRQALDTLAQRPEPIPDAPAAAPPGAAPAARIPTPPTLKVMVAVHGIGDQLRGQTVQAVAERMSTDMSPPLPLLPLGHFNFGDEVQLRLSELVAPGGWRGDSREHLYFAEVYWASIPRSVVKEADTLEEAKAWGKTVVSRARALYQQVQTDMDAADFDLAAGAVEEVVETVEIVENLTAVLGKLGIFKFDLAPLLRDYVGDVQIVADFPVYREAILHRFQHTLAGVHAAMQQKAHRLAAQCAAEHGLSEDEAALWEAAVQHEIHVVAHSEGTVVSFLGLLKALSGQAVADPKAGAGSAPSLDWVDHVRGFMTLGSPIDKHLVLWPDMWEGLAQIGPGRLGRIRWRNYADLGDPVGFQLDTARDWMAREGITAFEFGPEHDFSFARYLLPGKAHVDYWKDKAVFRHFVEQVVLPSATPPEPPRHRWVALRLGVLIPYALSFACQSGAVYLLYKAVAQWQSAQHATTLLTLAHVMLLAWLLAGCTAAARLPRLLNRRRHGMQAAAVLAWAAGAAPLVGWASGHSNEMLAALGGVFGGGSFAGALALALLALLPASSGWWAPRQPRYGRRLLVGLGVALVAVLVGVVLDALPPSAAGKGDPALWPVVLALAAFVYAWWLGILLFDLALLWHWYIRRSGALKRLGEWHGRRCRAVDAAMRQA